MAARGVGITAGGGDGGGEREMEVGASEGVADGGVVEGGGGEG